MVERGELDEHEQGQLNLQADAPLALTNSKPLLVLHLCQYGKEEGFYYPRGLGLAYKRCRSALEENLEGVAVPR